MKIDQRLQGLVNLVSAKREFVVGALLGVFFAYITVVAIWRIRLEVEEESDPLKTRFGQTALAGLAGSVFTELISRLIAAEPTATPDVLIDLPPIFSPRIMRLSPVSGSPTLHL